MLGHNPESLNTILIEMINNFYDEGKFPEEWREFLLLLIPKRSNSKFRPLSLASYMLKITERMINHDYCTILKRMTSYQKLNLDSARVDHAPQH